MRRSPDYDEGYARGWRAAVLEQAISYAVNHPVRLDCLAILIERVASAKEIAAELGLNARTVSHHLSELHQDGIIRRVRTETGGDRRGGHEHFYEAVGRPEVDDRQWHELSRPARREIAGRALQAIVGLGLSALRWQEMETDERLRVGWLAIPLDERGEDEVADLLEEMLERAERIKAASRARLEEADEEGAVRIVAALGFPRAHPGTESDRH